MCDLIKALTIFNQYPHAATHCEHDTLMVVGVGLFKMSEEERLEVEKLGFSWDDNFDCWKSRRFGSA